MTAIFYTFRSLPDDMFRAGTAEPFRHALPAWRKLGMGPIVDRVTGNGALHALDNGQLRLCVWPEGGEYQPLGDDHLHNLVDHELIVSWSGGIPGPADLDNGNPLRLSTVPMVLADGEVWEIPEIRRPSGSLLPHDLTRDRRTGQLLTPIKKEYLDLWQECEFWFDLKWQILEGKVDSIPLERALAFVTEVLGLRYRFCDATQSALRVIDSVNVQQIIEVAIGWPAVIERIRIVQAEAVADQKKSPDPSAVNATGSSGHADSIPSTDQPAENSGL